MLFLVTVTSFLLLAVSETLGSSLQQSSSHCRPMMHCLPSHRDLYLHLEPMVLRPYSLGHQVFILFLFFNIIASKGLVYDSSKEYLRICRIVTTGSKKVVHLYRCLFHMNMLKGALQWSVYPLQTENYIIIGDTAVHAFWYSFTNPGRMESSSEL